MKTKERKEKTGKRKIKNRNNKEKERACAGRWVLTQAADKLSSIVDVDNKLSSIVADGVDRPAGLCQFGKHARAVGPSPRPPRS